MGRVGSDATLVDSYAAVIMKVQLPICLVTIAAVAFLEGSNARKHSFCGHCLNWAVNELKTEIRTATCKKHTDPHSTGNVHSLPIGCREPRCTLQCRHGFARNFKGCLICKCSRTSRSANVALHRPTWQSSTCCKGPSSLAVDGKATTNFGHGSCTATTHEANPWWMVDLGGQHQVDSIEITNRADCCPDRLHNLVIGVSNGRDIDKIGKHTKAHSFPHPICKVVYGVFGKGETRRIQCTNLMKGRYVTILIAGKNELLTLCEVKVFGKPGRVSPKTNLAFNKVTKQSSTCCSGFSNRAVDGNTDTNYSTGKSCTATQHTQRPWWTVDLGSEQTVGSVVITNRGDCCPERLHDIVIGVSNHHQKGVMSGFVFPYPVCAMVQGTWAAGETREIKCQTPLVGRYVTIMIPGKKELLTLCEVKVYAP